MAKETLPSVDLLAFEISTQFSECSVPAAELNKAVYETLGASSEEKRTLYAIGDDNMVGKKFTIVSLDPSVEVGDDVFHLALIRPIEQPAGRRGVFRRAIESTVDVVGHVPQLVGILGNDAAYVPLATFSWRKDGNCPYVQFGSEIRDDTLFVTTADEGPRLALIELLRKIIADKGENAVISPLTALAVSELADKEAQLDKAKEAQTTRRAYEHTLHTKTTLRILDENTNEKASHDVVLHSLSRGIKLADGRIVGLALGYAGQHDNLQLLTVARGELALPIASFDKTSGAVAFGPLDKELSVEQRRNLVGTLHHLLFFSAVAKNKELDLYYHRNPPYLIATRYLAQKGLIHCIDSPYRSSNRKLHKKEGVDIDKVHREVDYFMSDYSYGALPEYIKGEVADILQGDEDTTAHICKLLHVAERFSSVLGGCTPAEERLFKKVRAMASNPKILSTVAPKRQFRNGTKNDVEVRAEASREATFFSLRLTGRPAAQPGAEFLPFHSVSLDIDSTQPLFDRKKLSDEAAAQRAQEILDILKLF